MHILVSGSSGLIGSALVPALTTDGHRVTRLVRSAAVAVENAIPWNPMTGEMDADRLSGIDGVVHLAGENIVGRWTTAKKARIRDSRVSGTQQLCARLTGMAQPPRVLVCASAVGYYGDRGDEWLDESSSPGAGFLPDVCRAWEAAAEAAIQSGIRVAHLRIGLVLSTRGGALAKMLPAFRMGVGGVVGSGAQYMSWIAIEDLIGIIRHALVTENLSGPVNAVAPQSVTNRAFTKTLGRVLHRPTGFPVPAFAARLIFGEMAEDLLLGSTRVKPARIEASGYDFLYPDLEDALHDLLRV